jgi:hypothetical protein
VACGAGVFVIERTIAGGCFGIFQADEIIGAAGMQIIVQRGGNDVVRRTDDFGNIFDCRLIVAQAGERSDFCHGFAPGNRFVNVIPLLSVL